MNSESSRLSIKDTRKAYIFLLLTFVLWGSLYVVSQYVLGKLPAFTIAFLRFLFAFAALSLFDRHPEKKLEKQHIPYILLIGFGGYFIAVGAQLLGTKYAGASTASLINSMNPVTMTLFGAIILHEQLTIRKILGIALSILGVFVILGGGIDLDGGDGTGRHDDAVNQHDKVLLGSPQHRADGRHHLKTAKIADGVLGRVFHRLAVMLQGLGENFALVLDAGVVKARSGADALVQRDVAEQAHPDA